jgi:hypothetical protein
VIDKNTIVQAFWDAAKVLSRDDVSEQPGGTGIDWNGPPAIEFLGSPFSKPLQGTIQGISLLCILPMPGFTLMFPIIALYNHAATFEPSYVHWPTDFTINARCDDPENHCPCHDPTTNLAYTRNSGGSNNNGPFTNFCLAFFAQNSLHTTLTTIPNNGPDSRFNLQDWGNQGTRYQPLYAQTEAGLTFISGNFHARNVSH